MNQNNLDISKTKNEYIKINYKKYTKHIINYEKHVNKLYQNWVIDINSRNFILKKLNSMVRKMIKIYNDNINQYLFDDKDDSTKQTKFLSSGYNNKYLYALDIIKNKKIIYDANDPFKEIKDQLIILCNDFGYASIKKFFEMYIGVNYNIFLDKKQEKIYKLYSKVFVPIIIKIDNYPGTKKNNGIFIDKSDNKIDSLMDNICSITIIDKNLNFKINFEGYIFKDILNILLRSSQICYKYIFKNKKKTMKIIKNNYFDIDSNFINKYNKYMCNNIYLIYKPEEIALRIKTDYDLFLDISKKNFNSIMKDFVQSDIRLMYNYITLLLLGDKQNAVTSTLLFNLLKDKKISGELLGDIIYHNITYGLQIKLNKNCNLIKTEMSRIKKLTPDNISIEKRLAGMINMPDNVKSYILERNNEIKSGENNYKLQMAINGLMQFPWKPKDVQNEFIDIKTSMHKSRNYLQMVAQKLDSAVYGHETSKKALIELVGKWIQNPQSTGQVIGLVGPPGIGKTLLAKSISLALGIPLTIVGLGGMCDSADLIGHSFTYAGAQYGTIIRQMIKAGHWRSVMFFDEVDKVSKRNETNEIYNTLIHITDPNMNQHFQDRFYSSSIDFDLSGVLVVFSYNDSSKLDPILLDRIKEIRISAYSTQEKINIAQDYLIKELCDNIGFNRNKIHLHDDTIRYIIDKYTIEAGVRELRRKLEQILLKFNIDRFYMRGPFCKIMQNKCIESQKMPYDESVTDIVDDKANECLSTYVQYNKSKYEDLLDDDSLNNIFNLDIDNKIIITQDLVHRYLDKPIIMTDKVHEQNLVGVINGLYATSIGIGGVLPIQIYRNYMNNGSDKFNLKLKLTGNQRKVMKESVVCALTTAINILSNDIKDKIIKNFPHGFHIHAPDGGTPKDGPSAGCAFATAFVSIILNKKINRHVAMTGEIELTGKISKIGGLDAKLAGAKKAGVKCVYLCNENKEDYDTIYKKSPELFDNMEIKFASHIIDIVSDPNVILDIQESDFNKSVLSEKNDI